MEQREIKIYSTLNQDFIKVNTDVTTWGQLKAISSVKALLTQDMQGLIKSSKVTLDHDSATLPSEPFTLFLMPQKSKGGGQPPQEQALEGLGDLLEQLDSAISDVFEVAGQIRDLYEKDVTSEVEALRKEAEKIREELGI